MTEAQIEWYHLMRVVRRIDEITVDIYIFLQYRAEPLYYLPAFKRVNAADYPISEIAAAESHAWDILGGGGLEEDCVAYQSIDEALNSLDQHLIE